MLFSRLSCSMDYIVCDESVFLGPPWVISEGLGCRPPPHTHTHSSNSLAYSAWCVHDFATEEIPPPALKMSRLCCSPISLNSLILGASLQCGCSKWMNQYVWPIYGRRGIPQWSWELILGLAAVKHAWGVKTCSVYSLSCISCHENGALGFLCPRWLMEPDALWCFCAAVVCGFGACYLWTLLGLNASMFNHRYPM